MPFKSEAQRGLFYAAAAGKARKKGLSQATAKKALSHDTGGKLPERLGTLARKRASHPPKGSSY